jgi:hypothetical protein
MTDSQGRSKAEVVEDKIRAVDGFLQRDRQKLANDPEDFSAKTSLNSWEHELGELKLQLEETLFWESLPPAERIQWANNKIAECRALIEKGEATPDTMMGTQSGCAIDSPEQIEWSRSSWKNQIDDCEQIIKQESSRL